MRRSVLCLWLALMPSAVAAAEESPVGLSRVETQDLTLLYPEGLGYLVPHAVRTFTNSMAFQRRIFGWVPSERMTVLLQDGSDYGSALAYAVPHGLMVLDVADTIFAVMTADLSCLKNVRLVLETIGHLGYEGNKLKLVLNRSNAFTGINVKSAEGALRRPIELQIVNEYRGAISALNTGAPFMIAKGDSVLGRSLADFAKQVDKGSGQTAGLLAPTASR